MGTAHCLALRAAALLTGGAIDLWKRGAHNGHLGAVLFVLATFAGLHALIIWLIRREFDDAANRAASNQAQIGAEP